MNKLKLALFSIIILCVLIFVYFLTYTFVEPKAYDFMTKYVLTEKLPFDEGKNIYGHNDVVLVVIDDKTTQKYRWPWKRQEHTKIFDYFSKYAKPKAAIFDFLIAAPDIENPESDKKFFNSIKNFPNLINAFMFDVEHWDDRKAEANYDKKFIDKFSIDVNSEIPLSMSYTSFMPYPDEYFSIVKNAGYANLLSGFLDGNLAFYAHDEMYRNHMYMINYADAYFPSMAMKTFLLAHNNPKVNIKKNYFEFPELNYRIKHKSTKYLMIVPLRFYKLYPSGFSHIKYSAIDIMESYEALKQGETPKINPIEFKDKVVLIGGNVSGAAGLNDNKNTPIAVLHPGVDIQATAVDNIMHNDFLKRIPNWVNILFTIFGMLFVYFTIRTHKLVKAISYTLLTILLYFAISTVCFYYAIVINVITLPVMLVLAMIIAYVHRYVIENKNKEKVESAMGKFMSEDVMKNVVKNIDNLGLGGKKATVTVLFSDIRGFTSLSENMQASQVSELLNEYFSAMEPIVSKYNGIINKFIGDAVMAVFGEPIQDENHPKNAVFCGFEMLKKVQELDEKWVKEGKPSIQIGVGINTGEVFVGNIGSEKRMEYTVIGDTVNLASRLESYNKTYKTKMLISSSTYEASKDYIEANKISDVEIRGKANKMDIYEVIAIKEII